MSDIEANLLQRAWRKVDIKLSIDGKMHILRWRRGWFIDEVLFDDRRVATSSGLFNRETIYGLGVETETGEECRLVLMVDPETAWDDVMGDMKPRGVRLETTDAALIAYGSLGEGRDQPFKDLFDRAIQAIGL